MNGKPSVGTQVTFTFLKKKVNFCCLKYLAFFSNQINDVNSGIDWTFRPSSSPFIWAQVSEILTWGGSFFTTMVATVDLFDYLNVMDDYLPIIAAQIRAKCWCLRKQNSKNVVWPERWNTAMLALSALIEQLIGPLNERGLGPVCVCVHDMRACGPVVTRATENSPPLLSVPLANGWQAINLAYWLVLQSHKSTFFVTLAQHFNSFKMFIFTFE